MVHAACPSLSARPARVGRKPYPDIQNLAHVGSALTVEQLIHGPIDRGSAATEDAGKTHSPALAVFLRLLLLDSDLPRDPLPQ